MEPQPEDPTALATTTSGPILIPRLPQSGWSRDQLGAPAQRGTTGRPYCVVA